MLIMIIQLIGYLFEHNVDLFPHLEQFQVGRWKFIKCIYKYLSIS